MVLKRPFKKTGTPLSEMTRNIGEKPAQKKPIFVPAEQVPMLNLLTEISETLKAILEEIKSKP